MQLEQVTGQFTDPKTLLTLDLVLEDTRILVNPSIENLDPLLRAVGIDCECPFSEFL